MKKSVQCEIAAAILMVLGAVFLVAVYFPVINPIQYRLDSHQEAAPLSRYILGTPVALLILWAAWHFNRKARGLKPNGKGM